MLLTIQQHIHLKSDARLCRCRQGTCKGRREVPRSPKLGPLSGWFRHRCLPAVALVTAARSRLVYTHQVAISGQHHRADELPASVAVIVILGDLVYGRVNMSSTRHQVVKVRPSKVSSSKHADEEGNDDSSAREVGLLSEPKTSLL